MSLRNLLFLLVVFAASLSSYAQSTQPWCGHDMLIKRLREKNSGFDQQVHTGMVKASSGQGLQFPKITLAVPVVVHIIHDNGVGNISDEQIQDALDILNEDYRRQNPDAGVTRNTPNAPFQSIAGSMDIEFKLAKKDPNGNCTNGIVRVNAPGLTYNANDNCKYTSNGGSDQWPIDQYVNIWVVNSIENDGGGAGIILGYAYLPYWPGGDAHGILIRNDAFGTIETALNSDGRTLTHEMGHLLGLQHIFNDGGNGSGCHLTNCSQVGDYCCDTPPQEAANWSCSFTWNSCNEVPVNDAFGFDAVDQIENYMSYNYCQNMFSQDQVGIMQQNFIDIDFMSNWINPANSIATGVNDPEILCKADFEVNKTLVCSGDSLQFIDRSFHNPTSWIWSLSGTANTDWQFVNGTTASSQEPYIRFLTPGIYEITLVATDGSITDQETKVAYIKVLPEAGTLPFWEGFESISSLAASEKWTVLNNENNNAFQIDATQGHTGTRCVKLSNFGQAGMNTDELISPPVDLSSIDPLNGSVTLSFRYAYRKRQATDDEWLKVFLTKDCGDTWAQRKTLHGNSLSSQISSSSWTPTSSSDWVTVHMTNVTSDFFVSNFRFKFEFEGDGGNNFFLDDINIYGGGPSDNLVIGLNEAGTVHSMNLYPNPAQNELRLAFDSGVQQVAQLSLMDMSGRIIRTDVFPSAVGKNEVWIPIDGLSMGMYYLEIQIGDARVNFSFLKQ